jgi:hypothetical protein
VDGLLYILHQHFILYLLGFAMKCMSSSFRGLLCAFLSWVFGLCKPRCIYLFDIYVCVAVVHLMVIEEIWLLRLWKIPNEVQLNMHNERRSQEESKKGPTIHRWIDVFLSSIWFLHTTTYMHDFWIHISWTSLKIKFFTRNAPIRWKRLLGMVIGLIRPMWNIIQLLDVLWQRKINCFYYIGLSLWIGMWCDYSRLFSRFQFYNDIRHGVTCGTRWDKMVTS